MAKLKLRKAKGARAKGTGGKKSKARAAVSNKDRRQGKAQGGVPFSGQSGGGGNSDVPF